MSDGSSPVGGGVGGGVAGVAGVAGAVGVVVPGDPAVAAAASAAAAAADAVIETAAAFRRALSGLDPELLSGSACVGLVEELAVTENACAAARAKAAARVAECGAHRDRGFGDPVDWLARTSGSSAGEAKAALATGTALADLPLLDAAVGDGSLSLAQAREVAAAAREVAGSEAELVGVARTRGLRALKDAARKVRLSAVKPDTLYAHQRAARALTHWRDELGMVCLSARLMPEVGVPFVKRLEAETDRIRRDARRAAADVGAVTEERPAHAADAFGVLFACGRADPVAGTSTAGDSRGGDRAGDGGGGGGGGGPGRRSSRSAELVIVCDLRAWRRGHAHEGEPCHIVGGGPLPVSAARELLDDPFVKAVLHDGVKIDTVVHYGRYLPAELRTALELGDPPDFEGAVCAAEGCGRADHLEFDHVNPLANRGPTSYDNLQAQCWSDHRAKTDRDREAGLLGPRARKRKGARAPRAP